MPSRPSSQSPVEPLTCNPLLAHFSIGPNHSPLPASLAHSMHTMSQCHSPSDTRSSCTCSYTASICEARLSAAGEEAKPKHRLRGPSVNQEIRWETACLRLPPSYLSYRRHHLLHFSSEAEPRASLFCPPLEPRRSQATHHHRMPTHDASMSPP